MGHMFFLEYYSTTFVLIWNYIIITINTVNACKNKTDHNLFYYAMTAQIYQTLFSQYTFLEAF